MRPRSLEGPRPRSSAHHPSRVQSPKRPGGAGEAADPALNKPRRRKVSFFFPFFHQHQGERLHGALLCVPPPRLAEAGSAAHQQSRRKFWSQQAADQKPDFDGPLRYAAFLFMVTCKWSQLSHCGLI